MQKIFCFSSLILKFVFCDSLKIYAKFIPLNHFQAKYEGVRWSGRNFRALIIKKTPTVCLVKVNSSFIFQCFNRKHRKTVIYCICLIISSNYNVNDSNVYLPNDSQVEFLWSHKPGFSNNPWKLRNRNPCCAISFPYELFSLPEWLLQ